MVPSKPTPRSPVATRQDQHPHKHTTVETRLLLFVYTHKHSPIHIHTRLVCFSEILVAGQSFYKLYIGSAQEAE